MVKVSIRRAGAALAAAAMTVGMLVGVTAPAASASTVSPVQVSAAQVSTPAAVPAYTTKQDRFWRALLREDPTWRSVGKRDTVDAGKAICALLKSGYSGMDMIDYLYDDIGLPEEDIVNLVAASVVFLCPGQAYKFE